VTFRLRGALAVLLVATGALVLAACGGGKKKSSTSGSGNAASLIDQTFSGRHPVKSGKVAVQIGVNLQGGSASSGLNGPISIKFEGPFQGEGKSLPKFDFGLTATAGGQSFNAGLATNGNAAVVGFQGTSYSIPANLFSQFKQGFEQAQAKSPKSSSGPGLKELGIDPSKLISDPKVVGDEKVGDEDTTHINAAIDVDQLLNAIDTLLSKAGQLGVPTASGVPTHLTDAQKQQVKDAVKKATIDVWTGKSDHTFRKLQLRTTIAPSKPGSGPKSADVALTIQLTDVNQPQTITLPKATKSIQDLIGSLGLGGALGGLGGSSGGSSGGGASGGASSKKLQKYERCIQAAGSDLTKAQKCASLLTG
jgi:hypothetical protein